MTFDELRCGMVRQQLVQRGIDDSTVLHAMETVPREAFVPTHLQCVAYEDCPQLIGFDQTISQPFTVAYMCQEALLRPSDNVLEVGTGSGYGAAVLSHCARRVHTVERIAKLASEAEARLKELGYSNVAVHQGDGTFGLADHAPFDVILVAAGASELPAAYRQQLADGGRILMPLGAIGSQRMIRWTRSADQWSAEDLGGFGFVPLVGGN